MVRARGRKRGSHNGDTAGRSNNNGNDSSSSGVGVSNGAHNQMPSLPGPSIASTSSSSSNYPPVGYPLGRKVPRTDGSVPDLVTNPRPLHSVTFKRHNNRWSDTEDEIDFFGDDSISSESSRSSIRQPKASSSRGGVGKKRGRPKKKPTNNALGGGDEHLTYRLLGSATERSHTQNIYGVAFNNWAGTSADIFATCGDEKLTVYQCLRSQPGGFKPLVAYTAQDENFYSCDWSRRTDREGESLLIAAGLTGNIRAINMATQKNYLIGSHPNPINDLKVFAFSIFLSNRLTLCIPGPSWQSRASRDRI